MTAKQASEILIEFNAWRRGDETIAHPSPKDIGQAIDRAIKELSKPTTKS
jgi:hypothetical protein